MGIDITSLHPSYLTDEHGNRVSVVLPLSVFEAFLEDMEDRIALAEADREPTLPHEDFMKELEAEGRV